MPNKLIEELNKIDNLQIECPNPECKEIFPIKKAKLFDINEKYSRYVDKKIEALTQTQKNNFEAINIRRNEIIERRREIRTEPEKTKKRITGPTRGTNFGQIIEEIVPSIKAFPYNQKDCRQLLNPIDYIVFNGLHNNGNINELKFVEVKSGKPNLNKNQESVKNAVESGKLKYLNVEDITNE